MNTIILLAVLYGLMRSLGPLVKFLSELVEQNVFFDVGISALITSLIYGKGIKVSRRDTKPLVFFALSNLGALLIYNIIGMVSGVELIIFEALSPLFVATFVPLFLKRRIESSLIVLLTISIPAYLLFYYSPEFESLKMSKYSILLLFAFVLFSICAIGVEFSERTPMEITSQIFLTEAIIMLVFSSLFGYLPKRIGINDFLFVSFHVFIFLSEIIFSKLIKELDALRANLLIYTIVPIFGITVNFIIFKEIPKINQILASIILFAGIFLPMTKKEYLVKIYTNLKESIKITESFRFDGREVFLLWPTLITLEKDERIRKSCLEELKKAKENNARIVLISLNKKDVIERIKKILGDIPDEIYLVDKMYKWGISIVDDKKALLTVYEREGTVILQTDYIPLVDLFTSYRDLLIEKGRRYK